MQRQMGVTGNGTCPPWTRWTFALSLVGLAACGGDDGGGGAVRTDEAPTTQADPTDQTPADGLLGYGPSGEATCPDAALPVTLEAEDAELEGVSAAAELTGFTGDGYVGDFEMIGDRVTFSFCVPEPGYYTVEIRYANGTNEPAFRTLFVDDQLVPGSHRFDARWGWSDWEPIAPSAAFKESVPLMAGEHRFSISFEPIDTGVMAVDQVTVTRGAQPSATSITSMLMNDWQQMVAGVFGSRIYPGDDTDDPPRIGELRWRGNWSANNVDEAAGYLRDVTAQQAYVDYDRRPMHTHIIMRQDGILDMSYLTWGDEPLPVSMTRHHAMVPDEGLLVVRYDVRNVTREAREFALLEYVDLSTTGGQESADVVLPESPEAVDGEMRVTWRPDLQAFVADLSDLFGTYVVFGAFQEPESLATGPAGGGTVSPSSGSGGGSGSGSGSGGGGGEPRELASLVSQLSEGDTLTRNEAFTGDDAEMGMIDRFSVAPGETKQVSFFYAVRGDLPAAEEAARRARGRSAQEWMDQTAGAWTAWLGGRLALATDEPALQEAYKTALVSIKQTQQPEFGSFVAATNPAYQFKVWPRDASVVAMGLDATNYLDEAGAYWRWMASVQETGESPDFPEGTWWTNYSYWVADEGIPFVQPEWDSLGLFTIGVYRHYLLLQEQRGDEAARTFLGEIAPAVERAANFIADNVDDTGFGPPDFSIWEDAFQYAMFTQVTYASGLVAAYELARTAELSGDTVASSADVVSWLEAARSIEASILAPFSEEQCTGLWRPEEQYFMRGIGPECEPDPRVDASSDLAWVFGLIDVDTTKAQLHRERVLSRLTPTDYFQGISRYEDDAFYYTSIYSPGGLFESSVPETTWPQMSMYMTMAEHWLGLDELVRARLDWYVATSAVGFMPPGEGIDWATQQPLVSTAVEPVTGTWFLLALLVAQDQYEPRLSHVGIDPPAGLASVESARHSGGEVPPR